MPTIYEIAKTIKRAEEGEKARSNAPSIVAGMAPESFTARPGARWLSPLQLLSLVVPTLARSNGGFAGFQRDEIAVHARKIARAVRNGVPMPVLEVALLPDGTLWLVDGQHRALGAVIADAMALAVIRKATEEEAQALFSNQGKGRGVNPNVLVLGARDPFSEYVQDALTSPDHRWSELVGAHASANRISANQMFKAVEAYCSDRRGTNHHTPDEAFDRGLADEMGLLLTAFGTKQTNPAAFRPMAVRAITGAAILVIRRNGSRREDVDRWTRHMPQFPFASYLHLRRESELTDALLSHWNKRLSVERRVAR